MTIAAGVHGHGHVPAQRIRLPCLRSNWQRPALCPPLLRLAPRFAPGLTELCLTGNAFRTPPFALSAATRLHTLRLDRNPDLRLSSAHVQLLAQLPALDTLVIDEVSPGHMAALGRRRPDLNFEHPDP